jgi:phosphatidylglycerophosphatase A
MELLEKVRHRLVRLATLGPCGYIPFGSLIASVLIFPFVLLTSSACTFLALSREWRGGLFICLFLVVMLVVAVALHAPGAPATKANIMLDKVPGLFIALWVLPVSLEYWKLYVFALALYQVISFLEPYVTIKGSKRRLSDLPSVFGVVLDDVLFGLFVHVLVRISLFIIG